MKDEAQKFVKNFRAGSHLFKQGEWGNTMFVIIKGRIELLQKKAGLDGVLGALGPGDLAGERALLSEDKYQRKHTAKAVEESVVLEVDRANLNVVHEFVPDFSLRLLQLGATRLDRANQQIDILLIRNDAERLLRFLVHNCRHSGTAVGDRSQIYMTVDMMEYFIRVEKEIAQFLFGVLEKEKLVEVQGETLLVVAEDVLIKRLDYIKDQLTEFRIQRLKRAA